MTLDVLYLSCNRLEFTKASFGALLSNTDWSIVRRLVIYDDGSVDGTHEWYYTNSLPRPYRFISSRAGSPVAIMKHYLEDEPAQMFAKIDSDTMVPHGWLNESLAVMHKHPELDLLGLEAFRPIVPGNAERSYDPAEYVGGIGLFRSRVFPGSPRLRPDGRFGFTAWQERNKRVVKGWMNPALPVALLDRMPMEPWRSLSEQYIAAGWQRRWDTYTEADVDKWSWFA